MKVHESGTEVFVMKVKKIIATLLIIAAVCSFMPVISGATTTTVSKKDMAKSLKNMGLLLNTNGMSKTLNRQDAYKLLVRGMGYARYAEYLKLKAAKENLKNHIKDTKKIKNGNAKSINYLYINSAMRSSNKKIGANKKITGNYFSYSVLRLLGYKVRGKDKKIATEVLAKKCGLSKKRARQLENKKLTKEDAVEILWYALHSKIEKDKMTQIEFLIEFELVSKFAAIKEGFIEDDINPVPEVV